MSSHLFVYGTLRRRGGADVEGKVAGIEYIGEGSMPGKMALVAEFPGVADDPENAGQVIGEVYRLANEAADFAVLDEYEDCRAHDQFGGVYRREQRDIRLMDGRIIQAWVYIYNRPMDAFPQIESGDFIRFMKENRTGSVE